jgi:hypothetical protein
MILMVRRRSCAVSNHESPDAAILRDAASTAPQDEDLFYTDTA